MPPDVTFARPFDWAYFNSASASATLRWMDGGAMELRFRAPKFPLRVVPRDVVVLVPRGRLCGYLHVPLVPT